MFYAYWQIAGLHWLIAAAIGAFPLSLGTIRQAKQAEKELSYPCYWLGLPRPVLCFFILALLNSSLFKFSSSPWSEIGYITTAVLIIVMSFFHLSKIPFVNHHERRWMKLLRFGAWVFLFGSPVALVLDLLFLNETIFFYDYLVFCFVNYIGLSWTQITREDRRRIRAYIAGEPLVKPLVHKENTWRTKTLVPLYLEKDAR